MQEKFEAFRKQYPIFLYKDYHIESEDGEFIRLTYDFEVPGLCEFHPSNKIRIKNLNIVNDPQSQSAQRIAFSLGMVELISYWKAACPPIVEVQCGKLSDADSDWWKKLYFGGLGEFLYTNKIDTTFDDFMTIRSNDLRAEHKSSTGGNGTAESFVNKGFKIVPIGGGKDSDVTMELTKPFSDKVFCFTVNDQPAREQAAACAGYSDDRIIRTYRYLDKGIIELNGKGFLNGHTPFSAIVAFLSAYCAYLCGAEHIILSNESSANESNVANSSVNHQYSKSYEFEQDFCAYFDSFIGAPIKYFSLLRAFNELQIAARFSSYKQYHRVFRSCNAGSKTNVWCCKCAKCLFVYIILSPFLSEAEMIGIFGENLLEREDLKSIFDGLVGFSEVKPFECVGTHKEINAALFATADRYIAKGKDLPALLSYFCKTASRPADDESLSALLCEFNEENNVPQEFSAAVRSMYDFVSHFTPRSAAHEGIADFIRDKSVLIMGYGKEGKSTYHYIRKYLPTKELTVADKNPIDDADICGDLNCRIICGDDYARTINDFDVVIKSPGISVRDTYIAPDTYMTCQLDLFMQFAPCLKIGITGTKGKSTTSTLTHCILTAAGFNTCLVGNIGVPVFDIIDDCAGMTAVIEMSCHQLEFTRTSPHIAILTNLYEEHLDHYNGFEGYCSAKLNIVRYQSEGDFFIHNKEQDIADFINPSDIRARSIAIGMDDGDVNPFYRSLEDINPHLPGRHNALDEFFAAQAAKLLGVSDEDIKAGLRSFEGIAHRLEFVGRFKDIDFYNDCIATVPTAVMLGVEALKRVNTLIIGGMDRGLDYSEFVSALCESKIENIICMPDTGFDIGRRVSERAKKNVINVHNMEEAVKTAYAVTKPQSVCLISPAASSYNCYKNFEEKGEHYKELVKSYARSSV